MDWLGILGVLGISNVVTGLVTWFLGGKRNSNANASLIEIDAINKMKDYYRDEITTLVNEIHRLNEEARMLHEEISKAYSYTCYTKDCPDRSLNPL